MAILTFLTHKPEIPIVQSCRSNVLSKNHIDFSEMEERAHMRKPDEESRCEDQGCDCCIRFRDGWSAGSIYRPGNAVPYNGSSYVAIHWNQNDPPASCNWATMA